MKIISISTFIFVLMQVSAMAQPKPKHYPRVSITEVADSPLDTLELKAIVKSTYTCPPCPAGAQCKPCLGDHVEVTNGKEGWLRLLTDEPKKYSVGKKYLFVVRFRSQYHRPDNVEIVRAKLM